MKYAFGLIFRLQMVLGAASYGRGWTLQSSGNALLGAPAVGANQAGPYTRERGLLAYFEIVSLRANGFRTVFHNWTKTNYGEFTPIALLITAHCRSASSFGIALF